jgi:hypothetical protein
MDRTNPSPSDAAERTAAGAAERRSFVSFRRQGIDIGELYFEEESAEVGGVDLLRIVGVLDPKLDRQWKQRHTVIVGLTDADDDLTGQMQRRTRYEVRRAASRDELTAEVLGSPGDDVVGAFADYYDEFARSKDLPPIFRPRLEAMARARMLVLSRVQRADEPPLAWHAYASSGLRSILLYSASLFRDLDRKEDRNMVGRANRYLHWQDMLSFRAAGHTAYDLGGIDVDERDPATTRIAAFKKSFGGEVRPTYAFSTAMSMKGRMVAAALRLRRVDF